MLQALRVLFVRERVLALAVLASVTWHIACISVIKVRLYRSTPGGVRFTSVSFLGSLPSGSGIEVRTGPGRFPSLDKRYLKIVDMVAARDALKGPIVEPPHFKSACVVRDLDAAADRAILTEMLNAKVEPYFNID